MVSKKQEKEKAILLRKKGFSYREILEQIPVAKSTLSLWLGEVGLSRKQKQRLTEKKLQAALRGAKQRRDDRMRRVQDIREKAMQDITCITARELWLMGIMLYWAEGSKEKKERPGSGIIFSNSDPYMIKLFLKWIADTFKIASNNIGFEIYIHENYKNNLEPIRKYWSQMTNFPLSCFQKVYFKKDKIVTRRKNIGESYYGLLRVKVRASSKLVRQTAGWVDGVNCYYWGVV